MYIEPFIVEHLSAMEMRPSELRRLEADPLAGNKMASLAEYGRGGTMFHDGKIIGIIGYYELFPRVYEVWAFPSIHVEQYAMVYLKTTKRYLQAIEADFKPIRVQTAAFADELHTNWMKFLGFECETPNGMRNASVLGDTMNLWSRVFEVTDDRH